MSVRFELEACDGRVVLVECDKALAVQAVPHFYFAVLAARCYVQARWRVGQLRHVVEVALLLQHVRFRLPLPHEQLA